MKLTCSIKQVLGALLQRSLGKPKAHDVRLKRSAGLLSYLRLRYRRLKCSGGGRQRRAAAGLLAIRLAARASCYRTPAEN
jgi:hypothetical protein